MISIDQLLKSQVLRSKTPSVQYAFFSHNSVIFKSELGVRNVAKQLPSTASTTYPIFSVTKTFTALSILQLAQEGKLALHQPAARYLPHMPYDEAITVEQLLNHSSGIPNPIPLRWTHLAAEHKSFDRDQFFLKIFQSLPHNYSKPGQKFKYSNLGYVLLGQIIEQVSGLSYENYILTNIIDKCGINRSALNFEINPDTHATGYHKKNSLSNLVLGLMMDKDKMMGPGEGPWKPFNDFYINGTSYGGLIGTRDSLITYAQTLMQKKSPLLNESLKKVLFTESRIGGHMTGMSLSWYTGHLGRHTFVTHAGGGGGYYVELRIYPMIGMGSVIMFNRSGLRDERFLNKTDNFFLKP